jgi:hypothetical protein
MSSVLQAKMEREAASGPEPNAELFKSSIDTFPSLYWFISWFLKFFNKMKQKPDILSEAQALSYGLETEPGPSFHYAIILPLERGERNELDSKSAFLKGKGVAHFPPGKGCSFVDLYRQSHLPLTAWRVLRPGPEDMVFYTGIKAPAHEYHCCNCAFIHLKQLHLEFMIE